MECTALLSHSWNKEKPSKKLDVNFNIPITLAFISLPQATLLFFFARSLHYFKDNCTKQPPTSNSNIEILHWWSPGHCLTFCSFHFTEYLQWQNDSEPPDHGQKNFCTVSQYFHMTEILFWIGIRGLMIWQTHQCKNMHKNLLLWLH